MLTDYLQDGQRSVLGRRVIAAAVAILLITGVIVATTKHGDPGRNATAAELVVLRQAGTQASSVTTARVDFRFDFEISGQRLVTQMNGLIDNGRHVGAFDLAFPEAPPGAALPAGLHLLSAANTVFISVPENRRDRTGGKAWASTASTAQDALAATGASPGSYLNALTQLSSPGSDVERLGDDTIRGVHTEHYRVRLDLSKVAAATANPGQVEQLKRLGASSMPMDLYIDHGGLPRKTTAHINGTGFQFQFSYELYDIGKPVDTPTPPAAQDSFAVPSIQALFQLLQ